MGARWLIGVVDGGLRGCRIAAQFASAEKMNGYSVSAIE